MLYLKYKRISGHIHVFADLLTYNSTFLPTGFIPSTVQKEPVNRLVIKDQPLDIQHSILIKYLYTNSFPMANHFKEILLLQVKNIVRLFKLYNMPIRMKIDTKVI